MNNINVGKYLLLRDSKGVMSLYEKVQATSVIVNGFHLTDSKQQVKQSCKFFHLNGKPWSEEILMTQLEHAIISENYEYAAEIRDELNRRANS